MAGILVLVMAFGTLVWATTPVAAAPAINIQSGASLIKDISPGQTYVHAMKVNNPSDSSLDLQIESRGFGQSIDGSNTALSQDLDKSPYSALSFITNLDVTSLHLDPGNSATVNATIQAPQDSSPGTRYAMIHFHSLPSGSGQVGVIVEVDVPLVLTVPGADMQKTGDITDLSVPDIQYGQPLKILTTFKNTGNYYYKVKNQIAISDQTGKIVATAITGITSSSVVPTFSRMIEASPTSPDYPKGLPAGSYTVESKIQLEDGTVLATRTSAFTVSQARPSASSTPGAAPTSPFKIANPAGSPIKPLTAPGPLGISWLLSGVIVGGILIVGILLVLLLTRSSSRKKKKEK
jgi:hypothetical protein